MAACLRPLGTLREEPGKVSLGCPALDDALDGGLDRGLVTEVCGQAGCGKTQLVLGCLLAQANTCGGFEQEEDAVPKRRGSVVRGRSLYLCTEGRAPTQRLRQIAQAWQSETPGRCCGPNTHTRNKLNDALDNILVKEVDSAQQLVHLLEKTLPRLLKEFNCSGKPECASIRLVVIDSITSVFRGDFEFSRQGICQRNALLSKISISMHRLSVLYKCSFLVVNQMTSGDKTVRPALGLHWSNCINARIKLSRDDVGSDNSSGTKETFSQPRTISVEFSPTHPEVRVGYRVEKSGLCGCICTG